MEIGRTDSMKNELLQSQEAKEHPTESKMKEG